MPDNQNERENAHAGRGIFENTPILPSISRHFKYTTVSIFLDDFGKNVPQWRLAIFAQLDPDFLKEE